MSPDRLPSSRWRKKGAKCKWHGADVEITAVGPDWVEVKIVGRAAPPFRVRDWDVYLPPSSNT